ALVLALDVVLPVPSGPLNTLAGAQLGAGLATLVCWVGMTAGAVIAFAATRRWGAAAAAWLVSEAQLANAREVSGTASAWLLLASRPVPVLAEATIILAGLIGVPWLSFVRFVAAGNLVVAFVYASVGHWASLGRWLAPALIASAVAPLLLAVLVRSAARRRRFG
ncbi:MAG: VTT domain-containing protein, partial [Planctomycetota bacterium]